MTAALDFLLRNSSCFAMNIETLRTPSLVFLNEKQKADLVEFRCQTLISW
jgi:hypothetical protein